MPQRRGILTTLCSCCLCVLSLIIIADEEEIEQKAEERRRKGQDPDWDVILNRTAVSPLVVSFKVFICWGASYHVGC